MKIEATVKRILFPAESPQPGTPQWYVLLTSAGKVVGSSRLPFAPTRTYTFTGNFSVYHGELNFKFASVSENVPADPRAILDYACTITHGLGPAFANTIWSAHGADYFRVLAESATCGTLSVKSEALYKTLQDLQLDASRSSAIADLLAHGATQNLAEQAFATFGSQVASLVKANPYVLAKLPGQSFKTVDARFRESYGIDLLSPVRVHALTAWLIDSLAEQSGDTFVPLPVLIQRASAEGIPPDVLSGVIQSSNDIVLLPAGASGTSIVSTQRLILAERTIADYVLASRRFDVDPAQISICAPAGITLDASQREAILHALCSKGVSVINGGAGCGKTTIIKAIAEALVRSGEAVNLCAFAGKAAARVREATGHPAKTIHSLLRYIPEKGFALPTLEGENVIIDEASMVPAFLLAEICKRKPQRLILVGDEAQLPPVGAGAPFHDIVSARGGIYARTVSTCYRNAEAIFQAAYAVRAGHAPVPAKSKREAVTIVGVRSPVEAQAYVEASILPLLDFAQDIIIAPRNGSATAEESSLPGSVSALNEATMRYLAQSKPIQPGARVICTKNNPELNVWNGTTGTVSAVDIDSNVYLVPDESGEEVRLPAAYCSGNVAPAYALTIHKAQGSQYRRVVILCFRRDMGAELLDRAMLYTAITRAKAGCLIVTDIGLDAVASKSHRRNTLLAHFLQEQNN